MRKSKYGLSLNPNRAFLKELVLALAVIFIWYGVWTLLDVYLLPYGPLFNVIVPIVIGLFLLYLVDEDMREGWYE